jgi:hypothetical protein
MTMMNLPGPAGLYELSLQNGASGLAGLYELSLLGPAQLYELSLQNGASGPAGLYKLSLHKMKLKVPQDCWNKPAEGIPSSAGRNKSRRLYELTLQRKNKSR